MTIPLEHYRGIESIDRNDSVVLVQAPIEQVAQAFSQARSLALWERDVCGREVEVIGQDFIVFQFRGHPWTLIHELNFVSHQVPLGNEDAQAISRSLNARAIHYVVSDTCGSIGYHLYDNDALTEMLTFEEHSDEEEEDNELVQFLGQSFGESPSPPTTTEEIEGRLSAITNFFLQKPFESRKLLGTCEFQSQLRQLQAENIELAQRSRRSCLRRTVENPYQFIQDFLCEQDVYIPALSLPEVRVGQRITLQVQGYMPGSLKPVTFGRSDFERLDYVASKNLAKEG